MLTFAFLPTRTSVNTRRFCQKYNSPERREAVRAIVFDGMLEHTLRQPHLGSGEVRGDF